jgi:cyclase
MLAKRIIPCLDVADGRVKKGVHFVNLKDVGDPVAIAAAYEKQGADELVFLDITATNEKRQTMSSVVEAVSKQVFMPLTVGGGIKNLADMERMLKAGADKTAINSAAVATPALISQGAERFGSQAVVVAIDVRWDPAAGQYFVYTHGGQQKTDLEAVAWAKKAVELGAGELLITSMDCDGTKAGYDDELNAVIADCVSVPLIASGGAGTKEHFYNALTTGKADAALAASLFHYKELEIMDLKRYLADRGLPVRL